MYFDRSKLLVLSGYTPNIESFAGMVVRNHQEYCASRGYQYRCLTSGFFEGRAPSWSKLLFILKALAEQDEQGRKLWQWVFWMDVDAIFTNFTIPIESLSADLGPEQEMLLGEDSWGVNTGLWLVSNSSWSNECLAAVWAADPWPFLLSGLKPRVWIDQDRYIAEQTTLWHYLVLGNQLSRVKLLPYYELGGYLSEYDSDALTPREQASKPPTENAPIERQAWNQGDFALHLAGVPNDQRIRIFTGILRDENTIIRE